MNQGNLPVLMNGTLKIKAVCLYVVGRSSVSPVFVAAVALVFAAWSLSSVGCPRCPGLVAAVIANFPRCCCVSLV
jgi:hypothetical protein